MMANNEYNKSYLSDHSLPFFSLCSFACIDRDCIRKMGNECSGILCNGQVEKLISIVAR